MVIGSGIAGLTATKQLLQSRPSLMVVNTEAELAGGLVVNIQELDGKIQGSGIDFASDLMTSVMDHGGTMLMERVTDLREDKSGWAVVTPEGTHYARAVIIASGATLKKLNIPGEDEFEHKGVSRCADCDGPLFSGQDVVVVGGGDSALQEARILSGYCRQVIIVNRGAEFSAQQNLIKAIRACDNVTVRHMAEVTAVRGANKVEAVQVRDVAKNTMSAIACGALFGFIGLHPSSEFLPASVARDSNGFLITDAGLNAGNRLFVAGAVRSGNGGMLEHAIAEGTAAADATIKALSEL
jgi:thioredoxin reductase (NADPH)